MVLQETAKNCIKYYNARVQPLHCSLNLLVGDVPVAVAVMLFLNSLAPSTNGDKTTMAINKDSVDTSPNL